MTSLNTVTFADLGASEAVVERLFDRGIADAFPIQAAAIEAALAGRDICGKAPTGSGKTLAFGVPIVQLVEKGTTGRPRALILAPTRELATQIKEELEPLAKAHKRSITTVFGGTNLDRDIRQLDKGVDILVACPGRLEDLIARRVCNLRDVDLVVVDEADRMADMGFLPAVKRLLDQTADHRHTMLFSATLDGDVDSLIKRYQNDPLAVAVEESIGDIGDVEHSWYLIQPKDRIDSAVAVLRTYYSSIVFCRTRRGCDRVAKMFAKRGLAAVAIHGDRSQSQRERALENFISGRAQVLVATDVAARGIHVDNVALVMHYDPAGSDKDYIHRSGRTGRAGQDGRVISMVVEDKKKVARQLQKDLGLKPGFDDLDIAGLPPEVDRPKPKAEPRQQSGRDRGGQKSQGKRRQQAGDDRYRSRRSSGPNKGRKRDDEGESRRGRDDDRSGRPTGTRRTTAKTKKGAAKAKSGAAKDWYPPGYEDGRGERKGSGNPRRSSEKDGGERKGSGNPRRSSEKDGGERPAGGSGTTRGKSRATKGRHADKNLNKNKGARRQSRSR